MEMGSKAKGVEEITEEERWKSGGGEGEKGPAFRQLERGWGEAEEKIKKEYFKKKGGSSQLCYLLSVWD